MKISLSKQNLCENHFVMFLYNRLAILHQLPVLCCVYVILCMCYSLKLCLRFLQIWIFFWIFQKVLLCVYAIVLRTCIYCLWYFGTLFKVSANLNFFVNFSKRYSASWRVNTISPWVHQLLNWGTLNSTLLPFTYETCFNKEFPFLQFFPFCRTKR